MGSWESISRPTRTLVAGETGAGEGFIELDAGERQALMDQMNWDRESRSSYGDAVPMMAKLAVKYFRANLKGASDGQPAFTKKISAEARRGPTTISLESRIRQATDNLTVLQRREAPVYKTAWAQLVLCSIHANACFQGV